MAIVKGTNGNDWIDAADGVTNGADTIYGFEGSDTIFGLGGNDHLYGGNGNDVLKGGGGADLLVGGDGFDTASYSDSPEGVAVHLDLGISHGGTAEGDTFSSIENLTGSSYGDTLGGDNYSNVLSGEAGDDYLFGRGGADTLNGGSGYDHLSGGAGADTLDGGSGIDVADYLNSPTGVYVSLNLGIGSGGDAEGDQLTGIEAICGSMYGGDVLVGDDEANWVWGYEGDDLIYGRGGDDAMYGHQGADWLYGMEGVDYIDGGAGADHIHGGLGADTLWGGSGADIFLWSSASEAEYDFANLSCLTDHICDFNKAEGDVIDLSGIDANENASGNQGFTFIDTAAFSGNPGEVNYFYENGDTYIQLQTDTSPDIEGMIRLVGIHTPQADWFIL